MDCPICQCELVTPCPSPKTNWTFGSKYWTQIGQIGHLDKFANTDPIGDLYECYLPRNITQGCVLSIIDSKMCGIEQNILEVKNVVFFKLNVLK